GGKRDNRSDRSSRPSLCPRRSTPEGEAKNRQQYEANPRHAVLPRIEAGIAWEICQEAAIPVLPILRIAHHGTAGDPMPAGILVPLCPLRVNRVGPNQAAVRPMSASLRKRTKWQWPL